MSRYDTTDADDVPDALMDSYESYIDYQVGDYMREQEEVFGI